MKMKKTVALILNLILIASFIFAIQITASAAEPSQSNESFNLQFELTADNGRSVYLVNPGQVITVSFTMKRTDSIENYTTNGFQNYIHYDLSFFEFVENSIVLYDTGIASAKKLNSITHGEIVQCQNMGSTYVSEFLFCTFQLVSLMRRVAPLLKAPAENSASNKNPFIPVGTALAEVKPQ